MANRVFESINSALLRMLIGLLLVLNAIRNILFCGARPIDIITMVIGLLVLIFSFGPFVELIRNKCRLRDERKGLDNLDPVAKDKLAAFALDGALPGPPFYDIIKANNPYLISRDYTGPFIPLEHRQFLKKWALKVRKKQDFKNR